MISAEVPKGDSNQFNHEFQQQTSPTEVQGCEKYRLLLILVLCPFNLGGGSSDR